MKSKYIKIAVIVVLMVVGGISIIYFNKSSQESEKNDKLNKISLSELKDHLPSEINDICEGKYSNLNVISLEYKLPEITKLWQINMCMNKDYESNTHSQNLKVVKSAIDKFYNGSFNMEDVIVYVFDKEKNEDGEQECKEVPFLEFENNIDKDNPDADKYFMVFGDARQKGGKGFVQIDSSLINTWFSKGEIEATVPIFSYDVKKVYNLTVSKDYLDDVIELKNGKMSITEAVKYVEDYLNTDLPIEKNNDFIYEVAEVRVLDVDGQDALGFCVRKKYESIAFDYGDGETQGDFNSEFYDDCGAVCMIKTDEIDNIVGIGGVRNLVEKESNPIDKIISLDKAFEIVSENIGESSVYDVYGAELVYQFSEQENENGELKYIGRIKWKIITRNQKDSKDTWFYVDVVDGAVSHRFKKIYGES